MLDQTKTMAPAFDPMHLTKKEREALAAMAKALPKDSPRSYATKIGIRENRACITDGFSLLEFRLSNSLGWDCTLDANFFPSEVKFPQWSSVIDGLGKHTAMEAADAADLLALVDSLCAKPHKSVFLGIKDGKPRLFCSLQGFPQDGTKVFNPALLKNLLKALPKGIRVDKITLGDESLIASAAGSFKLVLICIKTN